MGEANEGTSRGLMASLSSPIEKYPRDLLQRLMCNSNTLQSQNLASNDEEDSEELELNLGLSLGGRFGVDKNEKKTLIRSSSIAGTIPLLREEENTKMQSFSYPNPNLTRTSSLPSETEEWRKRKELQTSRRMAAKRRRSEKQRNSAKAEKESSSLDEEKREIEGRLGLNLRDNKQQFALSNALNSTVIPSFGLPTWAAGARQSVLCDGTGLVAKGKSGGFLGFEQLGSQGSMDSQAGSSSGISELECKPPQVSSGSAEAKSAASNQLLHDTSNQDVTGSSGTKATENACTTSRAKMKNISKSHDTKVQDMPCVFVKGDGPNGRRVDGILYRYGKGEEVRIMCICHGEFHTPAEFVKHAGGGEVTHPLRHIVVNPSSTTML